jgi:predicted secreted protein
MTPTAARAASARLAISLALLLGGAGTALAGDRALLDLIGFSADGRHFAFEEYGVQDGSGFPYANIYVLDLRADAWVRGTPVRVRLDDEAAALATARAAAATQAAGVLDALGIDTPADLVAINGDGELTDGATLAFGRPGFTPNTVEGVYRLRLDTFPAAAPTPCADYSGTEPLGLALTLTGPDSAREIFRDTTLPASRGCPVAYRLYGVVAPQHATPPAAHVAIIATYPFGFEGPDRRFIAIPLAR